MHGALKTQPSHQLPTVSENEGTNYFTQILLKKEKTLDDAHIIYEKIKGFSSFHDFFAGNLNKLDMSKILNVCQCFKYEKYNRGDFVFKQGDRSNDKFYIILSGEVAVMNNQRLGDFGSTQPHATVSRSPQSVTFLTAKDYSTAKQSSLNSVSEFPRKHPVFKNLKEIDNQKKTLQRLENVRDSSEPAPSKSKIASKMKKVYDAVKAVRTMQRCLPGFKKAGSLLSEPENKEAVGTLQYLDEVEDKEEEDRKEFEAMASSYGTIMQYSTVGESFGELAAKKNAARNRGILCRTDVEFLVLEKQQYDEVFGKLEKEREEFLKSVFPILTSISSANYNFLVCCFKTERYSKGSYIINEGPKDPNKKAKFYIIQSGECVLEKKMPKKTKNTVNIKQKVASLYDNVQITVAGKGSIIGEEILDSQDQYEYSVKVLSETVIVQAITKKDFRYRFPQDFQEYVTSLYETKQKHRETMLNALRKDIPSEKPESKSTNTSSVASTSIPHLATQSARQTFSRYLQRESKVDPAAILKTTISPRTNQPTSHRESSLPSFRGMYNLESSKEVLTQTFRGPSLDKEKGPSKSDKPIRGDPVRLKIDFLNRISSPSKQNAQNEEGVFESGGFFSEFQNDKDRKTIKIRLAHKTKQNNKGEKKAVEGQSKGVRDSVDLIMNKFFSRKEDLEMVQKAIMNQVEQQDIVAENTTKPPLVLTKSLAQSRRGSMKAGTISDLNSLYNQKLLKGRPSIRQLSPSGLKTVESKSKPQSLNEIPSKEFLSTKPDTNSIRRTGGNASWSLNSLKLHPETEKSLSRGKNAKSRCELDEELGIPSIKQLSTEDDKEYVSSRLLEKEKEILKEKALINLVNMMDTNRKKKSPQTSFSGMSKGMSSKGENPNPMYTHLNEAREWRMKVFRKPQRLQTVINSARTSCENIRVAPEGKKPFEV